LCVLERIGHATIQSGERAGKKRPLDGRCSMCQQAGRKENDGSKRSPKTMWRCTNCPDTLIMCDTKARNCLGEYRLDREMEMFTAS